MLRGPHIIHHNELVIEIIHLMSTAESYGEVIYIYIFK